MSPTPKKERLAKGLWWDRNWPVLEGCSPCSPACDNCFAAEYAHRFAGSLPYLASLTDANGKWNGTVRMRLDQLDLPLRTKKPTVWFVAERSDLFHPAVPDEYLDRIFAVMAMAPRHTFMVLTKRPERMRESFPGWDGTRSVETMRPNIMGALCLPFPNIWLGTTVWDQDSADRNIPLLLDTPAAHSFVSVEPMLGAVDMKFHLGLAKNHEDLRGEIGWVICGGESGRNARPVHPDWVRSLRDQCAAAGVPFLFKQWGEWAPSSQAAGKGRITHAICPDGQVAPFVREKMLDACRDCTRWEDLRRGGKKAAGRLLDGREHLGVPL